VEALLGNLAEVSAARVVVVSTIDVYGSPRDVDEESPPDPVEPYGVNRLLFEERVREGFDSVLIVRLPALYGPGLRKNALYDLLNDRMLEAIRPDAAFQWYDVRRLWAGISRCWDAGLELANFATEPVLTRELIEREFPGFVAAEHEGEPPRYDMRTRHAESLGGHGHYLESADEVLSGLSGFVGDVRSGALACA
jgi:nucleoside-diphosphate-sugar epimerase